MFVRIANILTIAIVAIVYAMKTAAYLIPWRGLDRLRASLALSALTWTVLWCAVLLQAFQVVSETLPSWFVWVIRIALIVFGIGNIVELIRAGAFRRSVRPLRSMRHRNRNRTTP